MPTRALLSYNPCALLPGGSTRRSIMPTPTTLSSSTSTTGPLPGATAGGKPVFITTSWDDGHPLDIRIAELLAKYDLPGTFYIPRASQRPTMEESAVGE